MSQVQTAVSHAADTPQPGTAAGAAIVIEPPRRAMRLNWREMWRYRELLYFLVWRDVKVRYKQTFLGAGWAVIQPLLSMVVFSVVFGAFARIPSDGVPYPLFVYAGLLPWMLLASSISQSGVSLVNQSALLTKIYFPRLFVPAATIAVALVDFMIASLVYVGIVLWYGHWVSWSVLLVPVLVALTLVTAAGVGIFMAALTVTYRDFRQVVPFMLQIWMYASPVVYPLSIVPEGYKWAYALNPMVGILGAFRGALLNQPIPWGLLGLSACTAAALLALGLWNFQRTERRFADVA
jgi:lipopolysaccharide transport system permease protein